MKILSLLTIIIGFSQCASTQLVKNPPFKVETATYNNWVGGVAGVSGTNVEIKLSEKGTVVFDSLFFRKKSTKIEVRGTTLAAYFNTSNRAKYDVILNENPTKEINNKIPKVDKFPFDLKENEAVISYKIGTETKFFKIENIEKLKTDHLPKIQ